MNAIPRSLLCVLLLGPMAQAGEMRATIDRVLPRVVKIFGAGGLANLEAYGTGFLISPDGYLVTQWNHVLDTDRVTVVLDDGRRFAAELVGAEPALELAVLKIPAESLPCFDLAEASRAGPGTRVLAFSNMFQVAVGDEPVSVVHGVVSASVDLRARRGRYGVDYDGPVYVVDAITNNSGAAGGVLTTRDGRLLGMIGRQVRNEDSHTWLNYAIPITELVETIREIQSGQFTRRREEPSGPAAGRFSAADFGILLVPDVVERTPAYVDAVLRDTPAEVAGLLPDDLIVFANERLVPSCRSLAEELGRLQPADDLVLVVRRGGALMTVTLRAPTARPEP